MDSRRPERSIALNHIPHIAIRHRLAYTIGSRMQLVVVHPRLEARGRPFSCSPRCRSRVNLRVLRPLTRGPQGQPSPMQTPHTRPGVQGIFPISRGQVPHGWPMVPDSMATSFRMPRGCCMAPVAADASLLCSNRFATPRARSPHPVPGPAPAPGPPPSLVPVPHPVFIPHRDLHPSRDVLCHWHGSLPSFPRAILGSPPWACGPSVPPCPWCLFFLVPRSSSRVYTPPGREQRCGAGLKDRFVPLAQVAPICTPVFAYFSLCVGCFLFFLCPSSLRTPLAIIPSHAPSACPLLCRVLWVSF